MIVSYRDKRTRDFAAGKRVKAFSGIERAARLKLDRLDAAVVLKDLAVLPGNRFEALRGDRKGQYSIRINDQWRICFEWPEDTAGPSNVEIVDYHQEKQYGTDRNSPRRTSGRRTEGTRHERRGACAAARRSDQPRHRDPQWKARHYRRHSVASRPFFWDDGRILAEPAKPF